MRELIRTGALAAVATMLTLGTLHALAAMPDTAAPLAVNIDNFSFTPVEIHVKTGGTVTWTNRDDIPHTVTDAADPRGTRSPALDTGDHYSRTFPKPGRYGYFCSLHPHMQGSVVVE